MKEGELSKYKGRYIKIDEQIPKGFFISITKTEQNYLFYAKHSKNEINVYWNGFYLFNTMHELKQDLLCRVNIPDSDGDSNFFSGRNNIKNLRDNSKELFYKFKTLKEILKKL